ncbi:MAG TPA: hypothetical protein VFP10_07520 [Candidatus Eisenbacteria bacterium]|nr:hypothetical protein [Candidatus Eisenbacteria bacterium]
MHIGRVSIRIGLAAGALLFSWCVASTAEATLWNVKADGSGDTPTLQAAILAAASGDTVLIFPGTYTEHCTLDAKTLVLQGKDGAEATFLDGEFAGRVLEVNAGEVTLSGLTIENGLKTGIEVDNQGAGIAAFQSFIAIKNCVFRSNVAAIGGAVFVGSFSAPKAGGAPSGSVATPSLVVENTVFQNNVATQSGGGIHSDEVPSYIVDCTFQGNHAGELGGGIDLLHADHHVERCRFETNNAFHGGGLSWSGFGVLSLIQVTFQQNLADTFGGGLWVVNATQILLDHVWFLENLADRGGGAYLARVNASAGRCFWRGNSGSVRGGGAYFEEISGGAFDTSTWMENTSPIGAAFMIDRGELHLTSSIVTEESSAVMCVGGANVTAACMVGGPATEACFNFVLRTAVSGCDATPEFLCSIPSPAGCGPAGHATATCPEGTCGTPVRIISWGTLKARYRS